MKIPNRGRGSPLKFNLTPLIDVVFQLIIFFLAASHLARAAVHDDVELPIAGSGENEVHDSSQRMIVTVPATGILQVAGDEVDLPGFELKLREALKKAGGNPAQFEVRIRTDRRVPYRVLRELLMSCARIGVTQIKFVVLPG